MILTNIIVYCILVSMITIESIYGTTTTEVYTSTEISTTTMTEDATTKSVAGTVKIDTTTTTDQSTVTVVDAVTASNNNSTESMENGCEELAIRFYNSFIYGVMGVILTMYLL
ncbi:Hypothetical predicted protein [Mytilus galloprovincialis]|uniref:Uncharacterized protein n=1 Tax=Mytilus galloprovincialis TaxID=29158 RepID=A0A8B6FPV3_MYTGA|nr:Hypothetical predicted protein [Mytilus galloprovincialis]